MRELTVRSEAEWKDILTPEQFLVTRRKATEPAYSGKYCDFQGVGVYRCVCCGNALFSYEAKVETRLRSKWPTFREPVAHDNIRTVKDIRDFIVRHEVLCACCDAHLGYMCEDGRPAVGAWYIINSCALTFVGNRGRAAHASSFRQSPGQPHHSTVPGVIVQT